MSLIVEDGTGLPNAESYISVADANAYHAAIGNTAWAALASDALREQALRRATQYMVGRYRMLWTGTRMSMTQALDWPRSLVPLRDLPFASYYPNTQVAPEVKNACASLALRTSTGAALVSDESQRKTKVKIGPIETEYADGSSVQKKYPEVDAMLKAYLKGGSGQVPMERA